MEILRIDAEEMEEKGAEAMIGSGDGILDVYKRQPSPAMSPTGKFTLRLVIYGAFLLYLVGDLFIWHGFLAGRMEDVYKRQ